MSSRYRVAELLDQGLEAFGRQIEEFSADLQELPPLPARVLWATYLPLAAVLVVVSMVLGKIAVPLARGADIALDLVVWNVLRGIDLARSFVPNLVPAVVERALVWSLVVICASALVAYIPLGLYRITWDTPGEMSGDGALYTDEGFYSTDAITWYLEGTWYTPNEYNQYIALPLLQYIQGLCFVLFGGPSLLTVRVLNFAFCLGWFGAIFMFYRYFLGWKWALGGVALIALNHCTYGMSRFALAEMPMSCLVTWAVVCALYAKGPHAYKMAAACALLFSAAVLTKVNTVFLAPVVALIMIFVDFRWKPVLLKFLLCSAVFALPLAIHYFAVVEPHKKEFEYFFGLNIRITSTTDPWDIYWNSFNTRGAMGEADPYLFAEYFIPWINIGLPAAVASMISWTALALGSGYRRHPLFWLCLLWYALFIILYSYYGRIFLRFYTIGFVGLHGMLLVSMYALWKTRNGLNWVLVYLFAIGIAFAVFVNCWRIGIYVFDAKNTYNEYAADVKRMLDADPRGNRVVMGHHAASLALRVPGLMPRHDRYGMPPVEKRIELFRPGWYTSEFNMRFNEYHPYFQHHEWVERLNEVELMGTYWILPSRLRGGFVYRGYPVAFYRLTPREEEMEYVRERAKRPKREVYIDDED